MERRIPVTNNTKMPIYVGSNMVPAGETRDFPESMVPQHLRPVDPDPEVVEKDEPNPLADLLQSNVPTVVDALDGMFTENIELLGEMEQRGQARKGVLSAISGILLARAAGESLPADGDAPAADPEGSA